MRRFNGGILSITTLGFGFCLMVFSGCGQSSNGEQGATAPTADAHGHDHPSEGPHHGDLVELGNEAYHAEVVHDDAMGTLTIYILDSTVKVAVPIDASEVLVNLSHDGQAEQFALAASPQTSDPDGKSSRFVTTDAELLEDIEHEGANAQLVLTIADKQYRGAIHHDHDHEAHADEHDH